VEGMTILSSLKFLKGRANSAGKVLFRKYGKELVPKYGFMNENPGYSEFSIGIYSYGAPEVLRWGEATLRIGNFCGIANGVVILVGGGSEHRIDWITSYPFNVVFKESWHHVEHPSAKGDVIIGNDVWIGLNALILSGVRIGDGAVIGASSVVTRDVPPYAIVGGNPARVIRMRFSQDKIDQLLRIKWWNWSFEKIRENMPLLLSERIDEFIDANSESV
jgi:virginiamycin A acetyltransferase